MVAPIFAVSDNNGVYSFSTILNLTLLAIAFLIFCRYVQKRFGHGAARLGAILLAFCLPLWVAVASGTESVLVLLIQIMIWINLEALMDEEKPGNLTLLIVFLALSLFARADGFVIPIYVVLFLLLKERRREALFCGLAISLIATAYFLWRYNYYGHLLPNTYYAKVSGPLLDRMKFAVGRLMRIAVRSGFLVYLLMPPFMLIVTMVRSVRYGIRSFMDIHSETFLATGWLLYWVYVGGDIYDERFLLIFVPLGISLLVKCFRSSLSGKMLLTGFVFLVVLQLLPFLTDRRFKYSSNKYDYLISLGKFLGKGYPGETLAVSAAGKIPFFSELKSIDMLGLTDSFIAHKRVSFFDLPGHDKYDPDYVLSKSPALIVTFIHTDLNLWCGLDQDRYGRAGYILRFLVNTDNKSSRNNIIDVRGFEGGAIKRLIDSGFELAVLEKASGVSYPPSYETERNPQRRNQSHFP